MQYYGIFRSTNDGATWASADSGLPMENILSLSAIGKTLFAGTYGYGVYRSTDEGASWSPVNVGLGGKWAESFAARQNASGDSDIFVGGEYGDIKMSNDDGTNWKSVHIGVGYTFVKSISSVGNTIFAGTNYGLYASNDEGVNWHDGGVSFSVNSTATEGGDVFVATDTGVFVSGDSGSTWLLIYSKTSASYLFSFGTEVLGVTPSGILKLTFDGSKWSSTYLGNSIPSPIDIVAVGNRLFAVTSSNGIFASIDGEASRNPIDSGLTHMNITSIAAVGSSLLEGSIFGGVHRSTNNGQYWSPADSGLFANQVYHLAVIGGDVFAYTGVESTSGSLPFFLYLSTDSGKTWRGEDPGFTTGYTVASLASVGNSLFAGTMRGGVWRCPLSEMITQVEQRNNTVPIGCALEQNYPNPFNPSTAISYRLSAVSQVSLKVYDVLDRKVATLVNGRESAGEHTVTLNASRLPSGVYFCRLSAEVLSGGAARYNKTIKLVVVK